MNDKIGRPALLKLNNCKNVMSLMRERKTTTITDIAEITSLSKTTAIKIIKLLKDKQFILPAGKGDSSPIGGKRPDTYTLNTDIGYSLTFYLRKKGVFFNCLNTVNEIIDEKYIEYDKEHSITNITTWIADFCNDQLKLRQKNNSICFGLIIIFEGIIENFNDQNQLAYDFPYWINSRAVIDNIKKQLKYDVPVIFDNHHRFSLIAEKKLSHIDNNDNIVYLECTEDGLGGAIFVNHNISYGNSFIAGEIGHMILDPNSEILCKCGGHGCFETLVSINRLLLTAKEKFGKRITLKALAKKYNEDDATAIKLINQITNWFAIAVNNVFVISAPKHVIISGTYSIFGDNFLKSINEKLQKESLVKIVKNVNFAFSTLSSKACIIGGSMQAIENYFIQDIIYS